MVISARFNKEIVDKIVNIFDSSLKSPLYDPNVLIVIMFPFLGPKSLQKSVAASNTHTSFFLKNFFGANL